MRLPLCAAFAAVLIPLALIAAEPVPPVNDAALLNLMPGASYPLPDHLFPAEKGKDAEEDPFASLVTGNPTRAETWLKIPDQAWQTLITGFAPIGSKGNNIGVGSRDPFNGDNYYEGAAMTDDEFMATPYQVKTVQGNHLIYERPEDMPADWPFRPNKIVSIPHLDGTTHDYAFYAPPGTEDAPPAYNSARRHWLLPAGEVYRARLKIIMSEIIPDLSARIYHKNDSAAIHQLAVILDRLADVYPGLPLLSQNLAHGLARSPDQSDYLTAAMYNEITAGPPPPGFDFPPAWWHGIYDYNYAKLNWGISAWTDGVMGQLGTYAIAFELINGKAPTLAYSQEKYGDTAAWEKRVRERFLEPARVLGRFNPPTLGNTAYGYVTGAVPLGIVTHDQYLFDKGLSIPELYLYNNWLEDGMPIDGAFNYAMMTFGIIKYRWMYPALGGTPLEDRFPLLATITELGFRPITTLYNIGSKHADQHARFFRSRRPWMPPPAPDAIPYADHELSQSFPVYGMTALRSGAPGSRLELIFDHQDTSNHVHESKLNIQLFYEGVELLPDFGYSIGYIDPQASPWKDLHYPHEMLGTPEEKDKWGPWRHQYAIHPEAHCVATIDNWLANTIPMTRQAYLGGMSPDSPSYWAQFVDAEAKELFRDHPTPVDTMRRQIAVLTLPNGRSLALDFFRLKGGKRHDLYWHVPSDTMPNTLDKGEPLTAASLAELWQIKTDYYNGKSSRHYGYALRQIRPTARHAMPADVWRADFLIKPHDYLPRDPRGYPPPNPDWKSDESRWPKLLHNVALRLWGYASGSDASAEILEAKGPWPGTLEDFDPQTGKPIVGLVGFKDALAFVIESRLAAEPGLETSYLHLLEPRDPDQSPIVDNLQVIARNSIADGGGLAAKLDLAGGQHLLIGSTLNGETIDTPDFALNGRLGALIPEAGYLTLFDGVRLSAAGWQASLAPGWRMKLLGVIGDLTGTPDEAALLVTSDHPLPTDDTLVGSPVMVNHQAGSSYQTSYTIAGISPWGEGRYRIDLAGNTTFLQNRMHVVKINPENPRSLQPEFRLYRGLGKTNYEGRRVRFPRTGWETAVESGAWKELVIAEPPPAGAIKDGDPFVIYTIQPGDEVVIHSHLATRGAADGDTMKLDIAATGDTTLTIPGYTQALSPAGTDLAQTAPNGLTVNLKALPNGRATILLKH